MSDVLRLSEAASLALHTMIYLARNPEERVSVKKIASAIHRSGFHLSKVLQRLARAGMVDSLRGPRGGFKLKEQGRDLTLLEIYQAIEGPLNPNPCMLGRPVCGRDQCIFGKLIPSIHHQITEYMGKTRLRDLNG